MLSSIKDEIPGCTFLSFSKTKYFNEDEGAWIKADGIQAKINGKGVELILPRKIATLTDGDLDKIKEKLCKL